MPTTDKKGRVQSSTVTVAVMPGSTTGRKLTVWDRRAENDFKVDWVSGTGAGGQHRNKTMNSARLTHIPTNTVKMSQTRSRENSYQCAMAEMLAELDRQAQLAVGTAVNGNRRSQVGSGERSDKRRTFRFQDGLVHDHITGKSAVCRKVMDGGFSLLWA